MYNDALRVKINIDDIVDALYESGRIDLDAKFLDTYFEHWSNESEIGELARAILPETKDFFLKLADEIRNSHEDSEEA